MVAERLDWMILEVFSNLSDSMILHKHRNFDFFFVCFLRSMHFILEQVSISHGIIKLVNASHSRKLLQISTLLMDR